MASAGCSKRMGRHLEKDQYLLARQAIRGNKAVAADELQPYLRQKPNKKVFGMRLSLYAYYLGKKFQRPEKIQTKIANKAARYDTLLAQYNEKNDTIRLKKTEKKKADKLKKLNRKLTEGNWFMRNFGAAPVVFDSSLSGHAVRQMEVYLKSKGFFNGQAGYKADTVRKTVFVKYNVQEGQRFHIGTVKYQAEDGSLKRLVNEYIEESLPKEGAYYDEAVLTSERDRLEKLFRNNGYFDFNKRFIRIELDTSQYVANMVVKIINPDEGLHKTYKVGKVIYDIDMDVADDEELDSTAITSEKYNDIAFNYTDKRYSPKLLWHKLEIRPGEKYSQTNTQYSQRNLGQLDSYKTVNINYFKDSANTLTARIKLASMTKYQLSDEIGFSVSQGLPGPFGSLTFLTRNLFGGCETFDLNARISAEGVASASDQKKIYRSIEIGAGAGITFPQLFTLVNLNPYFKNNNPRTRINLNYNFIFRPEYRRSNLRFGMAYFLTKNNTRQYSLSIIDVNYIRTPFLSDSFNVYLNRLAATGNNLFRSFQNTINTDVNFTYTFNDFEIGKNKKATYLRLFVESGGSTLNLLSDAARKGIKESFNLNSLYIYWKAYMDARAYLPVTKKSSLATRFNIGIANPYGGDKVLPYEKYFFSGGTNSIRAWLPRRLGPGSYSRKNADSTTNYNFEQPGLIQLEMNAEYRFKIIKFFDAALFVDAGNVWLIDDSDERKNFKKDFITEIAVASGMGFRFDFSFLIVRLDAGWKIWDPSRPLAQRFVAKTLSLDPIDLIHSATWNIAVGYPF